MYNSTIEQLYQCLDNFTLKTKLYIIDSEDNPLAHYWGYHYYVLNSIEKNWCVSHVKFILEKDELIIWLS